MTTYSISELWRYPVKSMGGERVESLELRTSAVVGDRRWAVRSIETGKIASAKRPRPYGQLLSWSARTQADGGLVVVSPDGGEYAVGTGELDSVLTEALGEPVQVVEVEEGRDETYGSEWPEIPGTVLSDVEVDLPIAAITEKTSFVDASAVHIIVNQSMKHLASLLDGVELGVERFRPNIVLDAHDDAGSGEFADLAWKDIDFKIGEVELRIGDATPRCVMTTVAQPGYEQAKKVLQVLAATARKEFDYGAFACFGTNAEVTAAGIIKVGDTLTVPD
ncbi:MAG: MOSC domain-containing protein [Acidimicrobiia bacterium]|nr:MOSC domain-containing protein [Acidimicrobiia bacterium]MYB74462.1 MOSC domain-containing protein [Acidimicrobiia bacterium]MYI00021.1 MOSC domain-containing protein [Acidimicrobiia bacterium]